MIMMFILCHGKVDRTLEVFFFFSFFLPFFLFFPPFFFEACGRAWRRAVAQTPDEAFQKGPIEDKYAKSERKSEKHPSLNTRLTSENSHAGNQRVPPLGGSSCTRGNPQTANPPAYLCGPMRPNQE